uniref:Uncharacterized protein n=1 Tax=Ditylenchus dipsaci TaxID=166011 RepID=A0A915DSH1_9BILA
SEYIPGEGQERLIVFEYVAQCSRVVVLMLRLSDSN